jgi:hypothetical protein
LWADKIVLWVVVQLLIPRFARNGIDIADPIFTAFGFHEAPLKPIHSASL